jgi:hypothetical protein
VLEQLDDSERKVALLSASEPGTTWTEAAALAGASNPEAYGERVRRKLHRLGKRRAERAISAAITRQYLLPGPSA